MKTSSLLLGLIPLLALSAGARASSRISSFPAASSSGAPWVSSSRLPLSFEPNRGQTDPRVKFLARGAGYTLFLASDEAVLALPSSTTVRAGKGAKPSVVRLKLVGAEPNARMSGERGLAGRSNYFVGNDPRCWQTEIPTYAQVRYRNVYRGIDLVYYGRQGELEYDFVVAPGASPKTIRLQVETGRTRQTEGGEVQPPLRIEANGDLVIATEAGEVRLHKPVVYQTPVAGTERRRYVEGHFTLLADNRISFEVGRYDKTLPLIIDPVLSYSTYLGGTGGDVAYGIAVDSSGSAYVVGTTGSRDFPLTSAVQTTNYGIGDVFVAKLNPTGTGLVYSTYLGGEGQDTGNSIAVDSAGNAYIAGFTYSTGFPVTTGVFQPTYAGDGDGFIAKLSAAGSTLIYASYIGGSDPDFAQAVAVDPSGNAYLVGSTQSTDFPVVHFLQIGNVGDSDVFLAKVLPSGTSLIYSTYLGGSGADFGQAIAVDASGNVYLSGYTYSSDFPTQNAFQGSNAGGADAFIVEMDTSGTALLFSTYLGGSGQDRVFGMTLDSVGSIVITGDTQSTDFPTTSNAQQLYNQGQGDAFVSKLSPGDWGLVYSTLLGGGDIDRGDAVAVDSSGNTYVTGFTRSADFPTVNPFQRILGIFGASSCGGNPCSDAFALKLRPSGELVYSTLLGGSGAESGWAIAVDSLGRAYLAGSTTSANFPAIGGASQAEFLGSTSMSNAFVAKIDDADRPGVALNPQQLNFGNQALNEATDPSAVTLINAGSAPLNITSISATGDFAQTNNCGTAVPAGGGTCRIQVIFTPTTPGARTDQITINDDASGSPQQITVTGTGVASSAGALTITPSSLNFPYVNIGESSPAQVVQIMNTGQASVTLSAISITGDFAETNTCGSLPSALNVGDGCAVSITFTPEASGKRTGGLTVESNATGSGGAVTLTGTGNALFSISANTRSTVIQIGDASETKPTFTIYASAASSFTDSIVLSCASGSCSFNPTSIKAGETSTLTVGDLSPTSSNPLNITVTGTSGGQTATVGLTIFFSDFVLDHVKPDPALRTVTAGQDATYTITVTPSNGFSGVVLLSCSNLPQDTDCEWSPSAVWVNGSDVTAKLTIETTTQSSGLSPPPNSTLPLGPSTGYAFWAAWFGVVLALLTEKAASSRSCGRIASARKPMSLRLVVLSMVLAAATLAFGCGGYTTGLNITRAGTGTPSGNYTIVITGTLGNNNSVTRTTKVNLSVGSG